MDVTGRVTGEDLAATIVKSLTDMTLDVRKMRGQCYDGAGMALVIDIILLLFSSLNDI